MGCQQSTTSKHVDPSFTVQKDADVKRPSAHGSFHNKSNNKQLMSSSAGSRRTNPSEGTATTATTRMSLAPSVSLEVDEEVTYHIPKVDLNGNLISEEIVRRTSSSLQSSTVAIGCDKTGGKLFQLQYAYRSQRGYNAEEPLKANQDKYGITLNLAGEEGDALFAVYDGHGEVGHHCANFVKKKLPQQLAKYLRQKRVQKYTTIMKAEGKKQGAWNPKEWPLLSTEDYEHCCRRAFQETNIALREEQAINDNFSGTTATMVCFHGGRMTACNVGDSRVVLGHRVFQDGAGKILSKGEEGKEEEKCEIEKYAIHRDDDDDEINKGELVAIPLTTDQTAYRLDERQRIRKFGGEIKTIDQKDGVKSYHDDWNDMEKGEEVDFHGDPPRVWVPGKSYPGCAFTRSFGDSMAESIGVCPDPEIVTCDLTSNDEILVVASDGIFEFLTNQQVINICAAADSPLQACEAVTKASYNKWIEHDSRSDDITIIVCFLSSTFKPTADQIGETTEALLAKAHKVSAMPQ